MKKESKKRVHSAIMLMLVISLGYVFVNKILLPNFSEMLPNFDRNYINFTLVTISILTTILVDLTVLFSIRIFKKLNHFEMSFTNIGYVFICQPIFACIAGIFFAIFFHVIDNSIEFSLASVMNFILVCQNITLVIGVIFGLFVEFVDVSLN